MLLATCFSQNVLGVKTDSLPRLMVEKANYSNAENLNCQTVSDLKELSNVKKNAGVATDSPPGTNDNDPTLSFHRWLDVQEKKLKSNGCPHPTFVLKHLCKDCNTNQDALDFSKERRIGRYKTNKNSVVFGSPGYKFDGGEDCVSDPVKIVTCTLNTGHCVENGHNCICKHSNRNGHLFYQDIRCQ